MWHLVVFNASSSSLPPWRVFSVTLQKYCSRRRSPSAGLSQDLLSRFPTFADCGSIIRRNISNSRVTVGGEIHNEGQLAFYHDAVVARDLPAVRGRAFLAETRNRTVTEPTPS